MSSTSFISKATKKVPHLVSSHSNLYDCYLQTTQIFGVGNFYWPKSRHSIPLIALDKVASHLKLEWVEDPELYSWYAQGKQQ